MGTSCEICENLHHTKISRYTVYSIVTPPPKKIYMLVVLLLGGELHHCDTFAGNLQWSAIQEGD